MLGLGLLLAAGRPRPLLQGLHTWSGLLIVTIMFFVIGGGGAILAQIALPQIRSWGRLSISITLLSMLMMGIVISRLLVRRGRVRIAGPLRLATLSAQPVRSS